MSLYPFNATVPSGRALFRALRQQLVSQQSPALTFGSVDKMCFSAGVRKRPVVHQRGDVFRGAIPKSQALVIQPEKVSQKPSVEKLRHQVTELLPETALVRQLARARIDDPRLGKATTSKRSHHSMNRKPPLVLAEEAT